MFANTSGIYVSYGGAVTKISEDIDGLYGSANIFSAIGASTQNFTSAVHHMFGVTPAYMLLLPIADPIDDVVRNKLLCWNGKKWFTSSQQRDMTMVATQEINSVLSAWATDGTNVFPIFQRPRTYPRKLQSKLWATPSYYYQKTCQDLLGIAQAFDTVNAELSIEIDCEHGSIGGFTVPLGSVVQWRNNLGNPVAWINNSSAPIGWVSSTPSGLPTVFGPMRTGQNGRLLGMTVTSSIRQGAINSFTLVEQVFETNV